MAVMNDAQLGILAEAGSAPAGTAGQQLSCRKESGLPAMSALQLLAASSYGLVQGQLSGQSASGTQPKRCLSLLMKIQPWGNARSAKLRALLGISSSTVPSAPSEQLGAEADIPAFIVQSGCGAKDAWSPGDGPDGRYDCNVPLDVNGRGQPQPTAPGAEAPSRTATPSNQLGRQSPHPQAARQLSCSPGWASDTANIDVASDPEGATDGEQESGGREAAVMTCGALAGDRRTPCGCPGGGGSSRATGVVHATPSAAALSSPCGGDASPVSTSSCCCCGGGDCCSSRDPSRSASGTGAAGVARSGSGSGERMAGLAPVGGGGTNGGCDSASPFDARARHAAVSAPATPCQGARPSQPPPLVSTTATTAALQASPSSSLSYPQPPDAQEQQQQQQQSSPQNQAAGVSQGQGAGPCPVSRQRSSSTLGHAQGPGHSHSHPREPLHPNWQSGPRRAAMLGNNARGWIPLHVPLTAAASVATSCPASVSQPSPSEPLPPPAASSLSTVAAHSAMTPAAPPAQHASSCSAVPIAAVTSTPRVSSTVAQSCSASPFASYIQHLADSTVPNGGSGGGSDSNGSNGGGTVAGGGGGQNGASSTAAERLSRGCTAGGCTAGPGGLSPADVVWAQHAAAMYNHFQPISGLMNSPERDQRDPERKRERDRDREERMGLGQGPCNRLGLMQVPLRGSRMQGHVTAVANPAYYAAAAAAMAAVSTASAPPGMPAAASAAALGAAPPSGREPSRRQRLLQQAAATAAAVVAATDPAVLAAASLHSAADPWATPLSRTPSGPASSAGSPADTVLSPTAGVVPAPGSCAPGVVPGSGTSPPSATPFASSGAAATALRPSLMQQRDAAAAAGIGGSAAAGPHQGYTHPPHPQHRLATTSTASSGSATGVLNSYPSGYSNPAPTSTPAASSATATGASSGANSTAVVASGLHGHAVPLRPGSPGPQPLPLSLEQQQRSCQRQLLQSRSAGGRLRRPSPTDLGFFRSALHRSTDGWAPPSGGAATGSGGVVSVSGEIASGDRGSVLGPGPPPPQVCLSPVSHANSSTSWSGGAETSAVDRSDGDGGGEGGGVGGGNGDGHSADREGRESPVVVPGRHFHQRQQHRRQSAYPETLSSVAAAAASGGGGGGGGGGASGRTSQQQQLHQRPISSVRQSANAAGLSASTATAGGGGGSGAGGFVHTTAAAAAGAPPPPPLLQQLPPTQLGYGTSWLNPGVSLLQALASGVDAPSYGGPGHPAHIPGRQSYLGPPLPLQQQQQHQKQAPQNQPQPRQQHQQQQQRHLHPRPARGGARGPLGASSPAGPTTGPAAGPGAGVFSFGGPPFLSLAPGGRAPPQRLHGRGNRSGH